MNMHILLLKNIRGQTQSHGIGTNVAEGRHSRLFHYVTQLTGEGELALFTRHSGSLDKDDFAADRCPRQASGNTRTINAFSRFLKETLTTQVVGQLLCRDGDRRLSAFSNLFGDFATE